MRWPFSRDLSELMFRVLFSSIFIGLGGEHIIDDRLIMQLMPTWVPAPRLVSVGTGVLLLTGGGMVLLGYQLRRAAWLLGVFLVIVTFVVHIPAVFVKMEGLSPEHAWLWPVLQRSNLVKNLCLLGVCIHLAWHTPGRFSLDGWLARRRGAREAD